MSDDEKLEVFLPYQKEWLNDDGKLVLSEKSRQIGLSWSDSATPILKGGRAKRPRSTYYISYNQDMTRQYVSDAAYFARKFKVAAEQIETIELKNERLINDEYKDITVYRIKFATGKELLALPACPHSLRSKRGDVVIDEAAFITDFSEVLKAAYAMTIHGGQIRVISTHNGDDNPFNLLIKDIRSGRNNQGWHLHRTTFDEAVEQGLYKRICLKEGEKWTEERQVQWVDEIKRIFADNIDEELNCIPRASGSRYFSRGLLDHATADAESYDIRRLECSDSFLHKSEAYKNREIEQFFNQEVRPVLGSLESRVFGGNDFGRSGDLTTYWLSEEIGNTQLAVRLIVEIKNAPFEQQQYFNDLVTDFLNERGKFGGLAIDSRGNGQQIGEHAALRHPGASVQVMETNAWYAKYGTDLHGLMESADFTVPDDETIKADFSLVVLKNGIPTIPGIRTADRDLKGKRHGDGASAAMLCVCAWRECAADTPPVFTAVEKKQKSGFLWW